MIRIGICDDNRKDQMYVCTLCQNYLNRKRLKYSLEFFQSGEEVLRYCENEENRRIDLLFLDIEMNGISGIELKNKILKENKVWRLVFVSAYRENVFDAFGLKTLGFVIKPAQEGEIWKWIDVVRQELVEEGVLELKGLEENVRLEEIAYFEAKRSYTNIVLYPSSDGEKRSLLITRGLGEIEKEVDGDSFVRAHRSYLVNLANIISVKKEIELRDLPEKIPIGRLQRERVREEYMKFAKRKVRKRI